MTAAVPTIVGRDFSEAPPGHRFRLYFEGWWTKAVDEKRIRDLERCLRREPTKPSEKKISNPQEQLSKIEQHLRETQDFAELDDELKKQSIESLVNRPDQPNHAAEKVAKALQQRQENVARTQRESVLQLTVSTLSPLVIGTGVEHPLENGFLFADPHGLPYLPGSAIKGVFRRAAEELALERQLPLGLVFFLFGFDENSAFFPRAQQPGPWKRHYLTALENNVDSFHWLWPLVAAERKDPIDTSRLRSFLAGLADEARPVNMRRRDFGKVRLEGALRFWDAYFVPPRLRMEVMTPHYTEYYQRRSTPRETDGPKPLFFLAVDVEVNATLFVEFLPPRLPQKPDATNWPTQVRIIAEHACESLGFGAKTAVGYGRLRLAADKTAANRTSPEPNGAASGPIGHAATAAFSNSPASIVTAVAELTYKPNSGTLEATHADWNNLTALGRKQDLWAQIPETMRTRLEKKKTARARLTVSVQRNMATIVKLEEA